MLAKPNQVLTEIDDHRHGPWRSRKVLDELPFRDSVPWKEVIAGYGHHSEGIDTLSPFELMITDI